MKKKLSKILILALLIILFWECNIVRADEENSQNQENVESQQTAEEEQKNQENAETPQTN